MKRIEYNPEIFLIGPCYGKETTVFLLMSQTNSKPTGVEWACRTILTIHFLLVIAGYINHIQAEYQLRTPVIPRDFIDTIANPYLKLSLAEGVLFILSLWFYFLRFRIVALTLSSIAVISYWVVTTYFLHLI